MSADCKDSISAVFEVNFTRLTETYVMRLLPKKIDDPVYNVKEQKLSPMDRYFSQFIRDERDLPFVYLSFKILCTVPPIGIGHLRHMMLSFNDASSTLHHPGLLLYTPLLQGWLWFAVAALDLVLISLVFLGPYTLMLHLTSHRKFFISDLDLMNKLVPWVIGPFMGQSPESYYSHHIGMHHPENNLRKDGSSTMKYQRDSAIDFLKYFSSFMLLGVYELSLYLASEKKRKIHRNLIIGELWSYCFLATMCYINMRACVVVFLLPYVIIRFGMMSGNWAQHAFIHPEQPFNCYTNSITCINAAYNKLCFNDGYHIGHHLHPAMHWTDYPVDFLRTTDQYVLHDAIVFEQLDFFVIWFFLMLRRYDWLAHYYVDLGGKYKSQDEVIRLLKSRTMKFSLHAVPLVTAAAT